MLTSPPRRQFLDGYQPVVEAPNSEKWELDRISAICNSFKQRDGAGRKSVPVPDFSSPHTSTTGCYARIRTTEGRTSEESAHQC